MDQIRITKLDAAKKQMNEAIQLFFERRDAVATHTLASAAAQVLSDLCRARGILSPIRGAGFIKEERQKEWLSALKAAENFFKHGDRDPDGTLAFNSEQTDMTLFEATYLYGSLTERQTYAGAIFQSWFLLKYPSVLLDSYMKKNLLAQAEQLGIKTTEWSFFVDLLAARTCLPAEVVTLFD